MCAPQSRFLVSQVHGYTLESERGVDLFRLNRQLVLSPHLLEISAMEVNVGDTMKAHTSSYTHLLASTTKAVPASTSPPTELPPSRLGRELEEAEGIFEDGTSDEGEASAGRMLDEWSTGESRAAEEETHVCGLRVHLDATCPICLVTVPPQAWVCKQISCEVRMQVHAIGVPAGVVRRHVLTVCASVLWLQEKFSNPVALSCGHVFCQLCACEAAGIPFTFGLRHASRTKQCPVCRQAGVYRAAMELREVAAMLKKGYVTLGSHLCILFGYGTHWLCTATLFGFLVPSHGRLWIGFAAVV